MRKLHLRSVVTASTAAAALMLGACSGGGDGGTSAVTPPPPLARTTDVPDSALANSDGLVAYIVSLFGMTNETSEPVLVGDITLPKDDVASPAPVN